VSFNCSKTRPLWYAAVGRKAKKEIVDNNVAYAHIRDDFESRSAEAIVEVLADGDVRDALLRSRFP
jgi:hypothetical protein